MISTLIGTVKQLEDSHKQPVLAIKGSQEESFSMASGGSDNAIALNTARDIASCKVKKNFAIVLSTDSILQWLKPKDIISGLNQLIDFKDTTKQQYKAMIDNAPILLARVGDFPVATAEVNKLIAEAQYVYDNDLMSFERENRKKYEISREPSSEDEWAK